MSLFFPQDVFFNTTNITNKYYKYLSLALLFTPTIFLPLVGLKIVLRLANFHSNKNRHPIRSYSMISPQNGANAAPSRSLYITYTEVKNGQHINMC